MSGFHFQIMLPMLIALQFMAFGWRINRELAWLDQGKDSWFPLADVINVINLFTVMAMSVVRPVITGEFDGYSKAAMATGYIFITFHPFTLIARYQFLKVKEKTIAAQRDNLPYASKAEIIVITIASLCAAMVSYSII